MVITSLENDRIKNLFKLNKKKYRDITNKYIVEGEHLVLEAYKAGYLDEVFILEGCDFSIDISSCYISEEVMKKISNLESIPSVIGLCHKSNNNEIIGKKILLLHEIQDPGNLGTIIRSAVAFNIDTIILSNNTVDLYNSKVLRSTQGMYCYINVVYKDIVSAIKYMRDNNIYIYGTDVNNGIDVSTLSNEMKNNFCLIMGNEGNGLPEDIKRLCDKNLYIKMNDKVESLNVSCACSILLYELSR